MNDDTRKILVTGAAGFVGTHLCEALEAEGFEVRRISRTGKSRDGVWCVGDLATNDIPDDAFVGVDVLIHLAASMPGNPSRTAFPDSDDIARRVATSARQHGVSRTVLLSSVSVRLFEDRPSAQRAYAVQKRDAELAFQQTLGEAEKLIILRPPVIYGPNAKGSFGMLVNLLRRRLPLPVAKASARRCYLSVSNLSALCIALIRASDNTWQSEDRRCFEPHDGVCISTKHLTSMIANGMGLKARMFALPRWSLRLIGFAIRKQDQVEAMFEPLVCDDTKILTNAFGWRPHMCFPDSLKFLKM